MLNVDKSKLQSMKSFDQDIYSRLNDRDLIVDVDRYLARGVPVAASTTNTDTSATRNRNAAMMGASGRTSGARQDRN